MKFCRTTVSVRVPFQWTSPRFKLHLGVGHKFQMDRYLEAPTSMGLFLWCGSLFPCKKIKIGCGKMWQAARLGFSCFWISWKSLATVEKEDVSCWKDSIRPRDQHGFATEPPGPLFKEVLASPLVSQQNASFASWIWKSSQVFGLHFQHNELYWQFDIIIFDAVSCQGELQSEIRTVTRTYTHREREKNTRPLLAKCNHRSLMCSSSLPFVLLGHCSCLNKLKYFEEVYIQLLRKTRHRITQTRTRDWCQHCVAKCGTFRCFGLFWGVLFSMTPCVSRPAL